MRNRAFIKRILLCMLLSLMLGVHFTSYADTASDKRDELSSEMKGLEQQKQEKEDEVQGLSDYKNHLSGELKNLDDELAKISASLDELEVKIGQKDAEIADSQKALEELTVKCQRQYESMKSRIKYTYENGQMKMLEILFASKSLMDFLNRSEYASAINTYDRNMLKAYEQTLGEIEERKSLLEQERIEYADLEDQMMTKQSEVNVLIADKKAKISEADKKISDAQKEIDRYEKELERQRAYEEELEKQKAREDAARLAEIKKQAEKEKKAKKGKAVPAAGDEALLAALIECEAGGESYEGMLAVGSVVMNRVESSSFPNTVVGVIYQAGQFSPVASGRFATVLARGAGSTCVQAANEVLAGKRTIDALYFRRNTGIIEGTVIGNHVFY